MPRLIARLGFMFPDKWRPVRLAAIARVDVLTPYDASDIPARTSVPLLSASAQRISSFQLLLVTILVTYVFLLVPNSVGDPDVWWHLRNAAQQLHTHRFLGQDMYSFTAPRAHWIDHEWLAELPFYLGWRCLAEQGLFCVTVCVLESIFAGVFLLAYRRCRSAGAALAVAMLAALLSTVSYGPRTLLFGWLGLVVELLLLQAFASGDPRAQRRVAWALPLLFVLWVNAHGSWLIGMVILLAFLLCGCADCEAGSVRNPAWTREERRTLLLAIALSAASLFVNPYGWELIAYPFDLAFHQKLNIASVQEWQSLDFHTPRAHIFLLSLLFAAFAQAVRPRMWTLFDLALAGIGVYAALTYSRFLFLAAILILPLLARDLARFRRSRTASSNTRLNAILTLAVFSLALHRLHSTAHAHSEDRDSYPQAALPYLESLHPQSNVWNDYLWGGYLEWYAPNIPVLIDSRVDIFERRGILKDYLDAVHLQNTLEILDKYKIGYVLFAQDAPLVYLLQQTHRWRAVYHDRTAILLERCTRAEVFN